MSWFAIKTLADADGKYPQASPIAEHDYQKLNIISEEMPHELG